LRRSQFVRIKRICSTHKRSLWPVSSHFESCQLPMPLDMFRKQAILRRYHF
jgi:hypothetical protein